MRRGAGGRWRGLLSSRCSEPASAASGARSWKASTVSAMMGSKSRAAEVEAADHRTRFDRLAGQPPARSRHDVDDPGVPASGEDRRRPSPGDDGVDEGLVVEDQRVRLPAAVPPCLVDGEAGARTRRRAVDFTGDEHRAVEQERWLARPRRCRSPAPSSAERLVVGQLDPVPRRGWRAGAAAQNSGWMTTGMLACRAAR